MTTALMGLTSQFPPMSSSGSGQTVDLLTIPICPDTRSGKLLDTLFAEI